MKYIINICRKISLKLAFAKHFTFHLFLAATIRERTYSDLQLTDEEVSREVSSISVIELLDG